MQERQQMFMLFVAPIIQKYDAILKEKNQIDFNDMINRATQLINHHKPTYNYQYIIIDEYQDISFSRFNLIKEIRNLSQAKLVCVGDDWQSIYRFAGSDVSLFNNFEKYIGEHQKLRIEATYRNSQALIDITAKYIQKNPQQLTKNPRSQRECFGEPIKFVYHENHNMVNTFINQVQYLVDTYGNKSILVLGRHSFDVNELIKYSETNNIKYIEKTGQLIVQGFKDVPIKFLTVHKSKGSEADNVILLNLKNHLLGFPNKMTDDPVLSELLSDSETYRYAEERRLFYVALTRTKNEVVLLLPKDISVFAVELLEDNNQLVANAEGQLKAVKCPYCQTGKLVVRQNQNNGNQFLGCSNYPKCNQTFRDVKILDEEFLCPRCRSGFMTKRKGKYGQLLGCTNFPECNNTINIT